MASGFANSLLCFLLCSSKKLISVSFVEDFFVGCGGDFFLIISPYRNTFLSFSKTRPSIFTPSENRYMLNGVQKGGDMKSLGKYDRDEALRVSEVTLHFENDRYKFRVHNSGHRYILSLIEHGKSSGTSVITHGEITGQFTPCKKAGVGCDPCYAEHIDMKEAAWLSIAEHNKKFHSLKHA